MKILLSLPVDMITGQQYVAVVKPNSFPIETSNKFDTQLYDLTVNKQGQCQVIDFKSIPFKDLKREDLAFHYSAKVRAAVQDMRHDYWKTLIKELFTYPLDEREVVTLIYFKPNQNVKNTITINDSHSSVLTAEDVEGLKRIRSYFGSHDQTALEHFAYSTLDRIIHKLK